MPIDYSKWNNIEISDDEDDQHPNIDTASLNKWRHEARVQRMDEAAKEKARFELEKQQHQQKVSAVKSKLQETTITEGLTSKQLEELKKQEEEFQKKEEELKKKERLTPWNVDTICHDGKSKTLINKTKDQPAPLTEEEKVHKQVEFTKKHKADAKKFGLLRKYEESERFLLDQMYMVCEETANYLTIWCIDLCCEEKNELMGHVAHQTIVLQFILELSRSVKVDARGCVKPFFTRIKQAEKEYMDAFNSELEAFKGRVHERAEVRIQEAIKEQEEEERKARLGPGGLDPVEVFESLPKEMQQCFEEKDLAKLQVVIGGMEEKDAAYHMKRCVDSGMWVPGGGVSSEEFNEPVGDAAADDEIYDEPTDVKSADCEEQPTVD